MFEPLSIFLRNDSQGLVGDVKRDCCVGCGEGCSPRLYMAAEGEQYASACPTVVGS
jgi:hypothetical protein